MIKRKGLFLDRDGTLIEDAHYLKDADAVRVLPGVVQALRRAREAGFLLFLHSNQSGIGRGFLTQADYQACHERMLERLGLGNDLFLESCMAPELPTDPPLYRKPSPRFIQEQVRNHDLDPAQCWMVGDQQSDAQAGLNAGIRAALVRSGKPITAELEAFAQRHSVPIWGDLLAFTQGIA